MSLIYAQRNPFVCYLGPYPKDTAEPDENRFVHFYLYAEHIEREPLFIGSTSLWFEKDIPVFCNLNVEEKFRGLRFANLLYQAGVNYLAAETNYRVVRVEISQKNASSQKTALRNYFREVGRTGIHGALIVYERDVSALYADMPFLPEVA